VQLEAVHAQNLHKEVLAVSDVVTEKHSTLAKRRREVERQVSHIIMIISPFGQLEL
jgi:hypothetical protein